jgi:peroxiredoxin
MINGPVRSWRVLAAGLCLLGAALPLFAQPLDSPEQAAAIDFQMPDLSRLTGSARTVAIRQLALKIRTFPASAEKVVLATELADSATDGAADRDTLQEVATTLAEALRECPSRYAVAYLELARLVRYEHMRASLDDPGMAAAMAALESEDRDIQEADFTLADLHGKTWSMKDLRGKVVLVNFWSVACPPCVSEVPALDTLYHRFQKKGLVILAISDDDATAAQHFLETHDVSYPVLLDGGRKATDRFHVVGIPRSVVYDRTGRVVAQAVGGKTERQFVEMLGQAGLR